MEDNNEIKKVIASSIGYRWSICNEINLGSKGEIWHNLEVEVWSNANDRWKNKTGTVLNKEGDQLEFTNRLSELIFKEVVRGINAINISRDLKGMQ